MKSPVQTLFMLLGLVAGQFSYAGSPTNCDPREQVFFSCAVGKKVVSICMQPSGTSEEYLEYRFGAPTKIELRYRGTSKDIPKKFFRTEITGASNSGTTVWFSNLGTYYVLNAPVRGGPFVEVIAHGKRLSRMPCKGEWGGAEGDLDAVSSVIEAKTQDAFFSEVLMIGTKAEPSR